MIFPGKKTLISGVVENSLNGRDENKGICCAGDLSVTTCMDSGAIIAGSFYTRSIVTGAVNTSSGSKTFAFYAYPTITSTPESRTITIILHQQNSSTT